MPRITAATILVAHVVLVSSPLSAIASLFVFLLLSALACDDMACMPRMTAATILVDHVVSSLYAIASLFLFLAMVYL